MLLTGAAGREVGENLVMVGFGFKVGVRVAVGTMVGIGLGSSVGIGEGVKVIAGVGAGAARKAAKLGKKTCEI